MEDFIYFSLNSFYRVEENLLWAKASVEKENQKIKPSCCFGGPLNSVFTRCSRTHTTKPVKMNAALVVNHKFKLSGFKKIHKFLVSSSFTKTTIDTPDSVYGKVKSTYKERLARIVMSPTTASNFCIVRERERERERELQIDWLWKKFNEVTN